MRIPPSLYVNDTIHRNLSSNVENGTLSCGFLHKPNASYTDKDLIFEHYGAFILLDGTGHYSDSSGHNSLLTPGSYVQRLPGTPHTTIVNPTGNWLEFFVCLGKETYETLLNLHLVTDSPVIFPGISPLLLQKCIYLLDCFKKAPIEQTSQLYTHALKWVIDIYSMAQYQPLDDKAHLQMVRACEYLCQISPGLFTGEEVASHLNISYETFRKKFRATYGISPTAYQLDYRINYSKQLLLNTNKSLNEISLICHFSDAFAFSKLFKKKCGISPQKFRQNHLFT